MSEDSNALDSIYNGLFEEVFKELQDFPAENPLENIFSLLALSRVDREHIHQRILGWLLASLPNPNLPNHNLGTTVLQKFLELAGLLESESISVSQSFFEVALKKAPTNGKDKEGRIDIAIKYQTATRINLLIIETKGMKVGKRPRRPGKNAEKIDESETPDAQLTRYINSVEFQGQKQGVLCLFYALENTKNKQVLFNRLAEEVRNILLEKETTEFVKFVLNQWIDYVQWTYATGDQFKGKVAFTRETWISIGNALNQVIKTGPISKYGFIVTFGDRGKSVVSIDQLKPGQFKRFPFICAKFTAPALGPKKIGSVEASIWVDLVKVELERNLVGSIQLYLTFLENCERSAPKLKKVYDLFLEGIIATGNSELEALFRENIERKLQDLNIKEPSCFVRLFDHPPPYTRENVANSIVYPFYTLIQYFEDFIKVLDFMSRNWK